MVPQEGRLPHLSKRQIQITYLISLAQSNKEISYTLGLSLGTVKQYILQIFELLSPPNTPRMHSRVALAMYWSRNAPRYYTETAARSVIEKLLDRMVKLDGQAYRPYQS